MRRVAAIMASGRRSAKRTLAVQGTEGLAAFAYGSSSAPKPGVSGSAVEAAAPPSQHGPKRRRGHISLAASGPPAPAQPETTSGVSPAEAAISAPTTPERAAPGDKSPPSTLRKQLSVWRRAPETDAAPHDDWQAQYDAIVDMRSDLTAPVDSMGTEALADRSEPAPVQRFQILVALMLSSQTKDEVTGAAVKRLQEFGLTPQHIADTPAADISKIIYPVGFYRRKGEYLTRAAAICVQEYGGDIPPTVEDMVKLPGVGPKMAYICRSAAWGQCDGIGVDVHVHRIANRLKWVRKPTKTPEATRAALEEWLPRPLWEEVNLLLVGFGQQTCKPRNPLCERCGCNTTCTTGRAAMRSVAARERKERVAAGAGAAHDGQGAGEGSGE